MKVDPDHKTKMGKGILQLAKDSGGPNLNFYTYLSEEVKDKNDNALIETFIGPNRAKEERCRGSHQDVYRAFTRLTPKGNSPTETHKGKGKGNDICYNYGEPGHIATYCPGPRPGKGNGKGK